MISEGEMCMKLALVPNQGITKVWKELHWSKSGSKSALRVGVHLQFRYRRRFSPLEPEFLSTDERLARQPCRILRSGD